MAMQPLPSCAAIPAPVGDRGQGPAVPNHNSASAIVFRGQCACNKRSVILPAVHKLRRRSAQTVPARGKSTKCCCVFKSIFLEQKVQLGANSDFPLKIQS